MSEQYLASIDQGTSSTRCLIFASDGTVIASASREHTQKFPQPGFVEHDPHDIISTVHYVTQEALDTANISVKNIAAVGITNQRETSLAWETLSGIPLSPAIVWQDVRTHDIVSTLSNIKDFLHQHTGLIPSTYFSGPKMQWIARTLLNDTPPANIRYGTIDTWLAYNLTGKFITDVTNASRTMLMNIHTLNYDDELLNLFGIQREQLPTIMPSITTFGDITSGPLTGVPLGAILGDQQSSMIGHACVGFGDIKNTYGTGNFLLCNTADQPIFSHNGLLTTLCYQIENHKPCYALEGSVAVSGSLINWLQNNLGIISSAQEAEELASTVPDSGGVYIVPAFSGLFAPHWRGDARGTILGLTRHTTRAHIARAALEAAALQSYDVYQAICNDMALTTQSVNSPSKFALKVDGGMTVNSQLMQLQSDLINAPVHIPSNHEITAWGAAYAAGLAIGVYSSVNDSVPLWKAKHNYHPLMSDQQRKTILSQWSKAIDRSCNWIEI